MLLIAKSTLLIFWLCLLLIVQAPLAKPFAMLLVGVLVLLLLLHAVTLLFCISGLNGSQPVWRDRLQLLLFGAIHLYGLVQAPAAAPCMSAAMSEGGSSGCQAD